MTTIEATSDSRPAIMRTPSFRYVALLVFGSVFCIPDPSTSNTDLPSSMAKIERAIGIIQSKYVDRISTARLTNAAISGMMDNLDPFSNYQTKTEHTLFEASYDSKKNLSAGLETWFDSGTLIVWSIDPAGPAARAGVLPCDEIRAINGIEATTLSEDQVETMLNPAPVDCDTKAAQLRLNIYRANENRSTLISMKYANLDKTTHAIGCAVFDAASGDSIGCVRFDDFHAGTSQEIKVLLNDFNSRGIQKFVLDLRNNHGGYVREAYILAGYFIASESVRLDIEPTNGSFPTNQDHPFLFNPLMLIVGPSTASAAELFAGMLQDEDRAVIAGMPTLGKALVMNQEALRDGSTILLVTGRCFLPSGRFLQRRYRGKFYTERATSFATEIDNMDHRHDREFIASDTAFHTLHGRTVYGGQGIIPDLIIPDNPTTAIGDAGITSTIIYECAREIILERGAEIAKHYSAQTIYGISLSDSRLTQIVSKKAVLHHHIVDQEELTHDLGRVRVAVIQSLAKRFFGEAEWRARLQQGDHSLARAINRFSEAQAFALR